MLTDKYVNIAVASLDAVRAIVSNEETMRGWDTRYVSQETLREGRAFRLSNEQLKKLRNSLETVRKALKSKPLDDAALWDLAVENGELWVRRFCELVVANYCWDDEFLPCIAVLCGGSASFASAVVPWACAVAATRDGTRLKLGSGPDSL